MSGNTCLRQILTWTALTILNMLPLTALAQVRFNLPSEPMAQALKDVATQAHLNIYFDPSAVAGLYAKALKADLTPEAAFARELAGTRLVAVYVDKDTVRVESRGASNESQKVEKSTSSAIARGVSGSTKSNRTQKKRDNSGADPRRTSAVDNGDGNTYSILRPVIVTAQRYTAQPAYDVPFSITVLNSHDILAQGDSSLDSLQFFSPGLAVQDTRAERRIEIGGISNTNGSGALVSEYIDNADVTASPDLFGYSSENLQTYDLKRVEVLMGPQGTLYGEGAEGGAIHFVTNSPDPRKYEIGIGAQAQFTVGGNPTQRLYPVVNVPLAHGKAAVRISGEYSHEGGWVSEPAAHLKGINSADISDTRVEALWHPIHRLAFKVLQILHDESYGLNQGANSNGIYRPIFGLPVRPIGNNRYYVSNLEIDYRFPIFGTVTSSTTYFRDNNTIHNQPQLILGEVNGKLNVPAAQVTYVPNTYKYHHYTEELRVHNDSGRFEYTAGAFYKQSVVSNFPSTGCVGRIGLTLASDQDSAFLSNPQLTCFPLGQHIRSKSWAGFVDATYDIEHRLKIEGGVRIFRNTQRFIAVGNVAPSKGTFRSTDPQFSIVYRFPWRFNAYINARKGFRSGGFNGYALPKYAPESVWWYEAGIKTRGMRDFSGTAELHFARYRNYQIFGAKIVGYGQSGTPIEIEETANGGTVHVKGGTVQLLWSPDSEWKFGINGDYENSRFVSITLENTSNIVGDPLDGVPRYQVTALIQKDFLIASRPAFLRFDYSQRAPVTYRNRSIGNYGVSNHLYLMNITSGIRWNGNLKFGIVAQNVLNDVAYVDGNIAGLGAGMTRPLTIGVYINAMF